MNKGFSAVYQDTINLQKEIAKKVVTNDDILLKKQINYVCGVDVSYKKNIAYCSAVIIKKSSLESIEYVNMIYSVTQPYIPGLFLLREAAPIIDTLKLLKKPYDALLIDGHGQLHPRRCGLACYLGVVLDKPTVGIAKSLLCGVQRKDQYIEMEGEIMGFRITTKRANKGLYVSIGHKLSLQSAIQLSKDLIKDVQWIPEPLRIADINSKNKSNFVQD
jgi:deoxyribonuclease V